MQIIDAHHHLWDASDFRYRNFANGGRARFWGHFEELAPRYVASDYIADFARLGVVKAVHIDAGFDPADPVAETRFLQRMADDPSSRGFPHAIVGWADLSDPYVEAVLEAHASHMNVRGIRQMLNRHEDPLLTFAPRDYLTDDIWRSNFGLLRSYGLSFDLSINPRQAQEAATFVGSYDDTPIALGHLGFPIERFNSGLDRWRAGMRALAERPNVFVKLSGLGMFDRQWTAESVRRIVMETVDLFGVERIMFGSNFPIDGIMKSPSKLKETLLSVTRCLSDAERDQLFRGTASAFYRI